MSGRRQTRRDLVIFGNGRFAEVAHFYFDRDSDYRVVAFTVDAPQAAVFRDLPVVDYRDLQKKYPPETHDLFIAVAYNAMNRARAAKFEDAKKKGYTLASYVSSKTSALEPVKTGENCFILEDNTIQPFGSIGDNVVLWSGNHIGHHVKIGSHTFVTSHVCIGGTAEIGERCFFGMNATVRDGVKIGADTLIGAGALVLENAAPGSVYAPKGTPPRRMRSDAVNL